MQLCNQDTFAHFGSFAKIKLGFHKTNYREINWHRSASRVSLQLSMPWAEPHSGGVDRYMRQSVCAAAWFKKPRSLGLILNYISQHTWLQKCIWCRTQPYLRMLLMCVCIRLLVSMLYVCVMLIDITHAILCCSHHKLTRPAHTHTQTVHKKKDKWASSYIRTHTHIHANALTLLYKYDKRIMRIIFEQFMCRTKIL